MLEPSDMPKPERRLHRSCPRPNRRACPEPGRRGLLLAALLLANGLVFFAAAGLGPWQAAVKGQEPPTIGIDADPSGNTATSLGKIDACVAKTANEVFDIDVFLQDVRQLLAWEVYIEYDPQLLEVVARQVDLFQAANRGSNVYDVSARLPDSSGLYRMAAADTSDPPTPDSGSGVLARLTLRAKAPGLSTIALAYRDLDEDGKPDQGPFLRNVDGDPIGDIDGDAFFDGPTESAQVAIDARCRDAPNGVATTGEGSGGIGAAVWAIAGAAAAAAAVSLAAFVLLRVARQRSRP